MKYALFVAFMLLPRSLGVLYTGSVFVPALRVL